MNQEDAYRPGVGMVLARPGRMVFAGRRIQNLSSEAWQMPQGGIDANEDIKQAMWRELTEEIGIGTDLARIVAISNWICYDIPQQYRQNLWNGRYVGQRQKWFLLKFLAEDSAISLTNVGVPAEFDDWKWVPFDHIDAMAVHFKQELYRQVQTAFRHKIDEIA